MTLLGISIIRRNRRVREGGRDGKECEEEEGSEKEKMLIILNS